MAESPVALTPIDPATLDRLIVYWLPELRSVPERRRLVRYVIVALFLIPFLLSLAFLVVPYMSGTAVGLKDFGPLLASMSWAAICVVYLGKLQACDDVVHEISLAVHMGYVEPVLTAIGKLSCYSRFQGLISDVRTLLPKQ